MKKVETERCILRNINLSDAKALFRLFNDEKIAEFMAWDGFDSLEKTEKYIENWQKWYKDVKEDYQAIVYKENGELIGTVYLYSDCGTGYLSYCLRSDHWRQGLAYEAVSRKIKDFFNLTDAEYVYTFCHKGNRNSEKLLKRLGFEKTGALPKTESIRPAQEENYEYFILKNKNGSAQR